MRARQAVEDLCALTVQPVRVEQVQAALRRAETARLSYWDALIVETAIAAGAGVLLTEDLQSVRVPGGLRVVDPFGPMP